MKHFYLSVILLSFSYLDSGVAYGQSVQSGAYPDACFSKDLINEAKAALKPDFIYDGFRLLKVKLKDKPQLKRMIFPLTSEVAFKYVFNRSAFPKGCEINLYYKAEALADYLVFSSKEFDDSENILVYEPARDMQLAYIEFVIPAASDGVDAGCVCVLAGYKL